MTTAPKKMFVNLPVRDLEKSIAFFRALGFEFNMQFTDDKAACMVVSSDAYVMLLTEPFFRQFTQREISDSTKSTEALIAIFGNDRSMVDDMVHKAIAAGGSPAMPAQDHGFMYAWSFYDLDGHHWEVGWMDPAVPQQEQ